MIKYIYKVDVYDVDMNHLDTLEGNNMTFVAKHLREHREIKHIKINNYTVSVSSLGQFNSSTLKTLARQTGPSPIIRTVR